MLVLMYGCGTVLIRELSVRWKMQWSVMFLAVAYGIIEEGITTKAFFNPGWTVSSLSGYGMYGGVQWPLTVLLLVYHAILSTLIPIALINLRWPEYAAVPILGKRGMIINGCGLAGVVLIGLCFSGAKVGEKMIPFHLDPIPLLLTTISVFILGYLAYFFKNSVFRTRRTSIFPSHIFGIAGFMTQGVNVWFPYFLASLKVPPLVTIIFQLMTVVAILWFVFFQLLHQDCTRRHTVALCFGSIMHWIILTPMLELTQPSSRGLLVIGLISLILLVQWRRRVS